MRYSMNPSHKFLLIICLTFLFCKSAELSAQQFSWLAQFGGGLNCSVNDVTVDAVGNVYSTGDFDATVDFDPGPGVTSFTSQGTKDMFVTKQDPSGNLIWARHFTGVGSIIGKAISVSPAGDIFLAGMFTDSVDADPGPGVLMVNNFNASSAARDLLAVKLSTSGNLIWANQLGGIGHFETNQLEVDDAGEVYLMGEFKGTIDFDPGPNSHVLSATIAEDIFLTKWSNAGDLRWIQTLTGISEKESYQLRMDPDANLYVSGRFRNGTMDMDPGIGVDTVQAISGWDCFVTKWDSSGSISWWRRFHTASSFALVREIAPDPQGNVYIGGTFYFSMDLDPGPGVSNVTSQGAQDVCIVKLNAAGNFVWGKTFGSTNQDFVEHLVADAHSNLYLTGEFISNVDFDPGPGVHTMPLGSGNSNNYIAEWDSSGNLLYTGQIEATAVIYSYSMFVTPDDFLFLTGLFSGTADFDPSAQTHQVSSFGHSGFVLKMSHSPKTNLIQGRVFWDENVNCIQEVTEPPMPNTLVRIDPLGYYKLTDSMGSYQFRTDTGTFQISVIPPAQLWTIVCPSAPYFQTVQFTVPNDSAMNQDFGLDADPCPYLTVNTGSGLLRPGRVSDYTVNYCNLGSMDADSVWVRIELDPLLSLVSSSIPFRTPQMGNIYEFDLDSVPMGFCGSFFFSAFVDSTAILGQALCVDTHIYPDSSCLSEHPQWDRASIRLEGDCIANEDSIQFVVSNVGTGNMSGTGGLVVLQDDVLTRQGTFTLNSGLDSTFVYKTDGSTWRVLAEQRPFHPGHSKPNLVIEGCGVDTSGSFSTGFVNSLGQDDRDPFVDIYCEEVRTSYDPNDKRGFPSGVSVSNFIETNQSLEYMIRFQNTGNDTAFRVIIRDTLDLQTLDITTLQAGATSHSGRFRVYGPGIAEWTFDNILLPDSNVNEPASHGFVQFSIDQQLNNPVSTVIENTAEIYFDYNVPVRTNTAWHTIGGVLEEFVQIDLVVDDPTGIDPADPVSITAYPNPFTEFFTVKVTGASFLQLELTLFDMNGQIVKRSQIQGTDRIQVLREGLTAGTFVYELKGDNKRISSGKLILR